MCCYAKRAIGGLRAVVYTEVVQAVVLVAGALGLLFVGLYKVGGLSQLKEQLPERYHYHHDKSHL